MFEQLHQFRVIGWDFDDTLVGHPNSEAFWRYIRLNPHDQTHYIVTMRSGGYEDAIFDELDFHGAGLDRMHFIAIVNPPNELWMSHQKAMREQTLEDDHPYHLFKGEQCSRLGIEVLIDDMEKGRIPAEGCTRHGVVHIDPDHL